MENTIHDENTQNILIKKTKTELYEQLKLILMINEPTPNYTEIDFDYLLLGQTIGTSQAKIHTKNPEYTGDIWRGEQKNIFVPENFFPYKNKEELKKISKKHNLNIGAICSTKQLKELLIQKPQLNNYIYAPKAFTYEGEMFYERMSINTENLLQGQNTFKEVYEKMKTYLKHKNINPEKL